MKIFCRVTEQGFVPLYDSDYEERQKLRTGDTVLCEVRKPRNYEFHKKFFALVRLTFANLPEHMHRQYGIYSEEDLLIALKIDLGISSIVNIAGRDVFREGSISFTAMDQSEFSAFYLRCINIILAKYLKGTDRQDLIDNIEQFK